MIIRQTRLDRFPPIVAAYLEQSATHIAAIFYGWPVVDEVVIEPATAAKPPGLYALKNHLVGYVDQNDRVDIVTLEKELGLRSVPREPIEHKAIVPIVLVEAATNYLFHDFIGHELPRVDDPLDSRGKLRVRLDIPAEDVADTDVNQIETVGEQLRLSAFAAALSTHDDIFVHGMIP